MTDSTIGGVGDMACKLKCIRLHLREGSTKPVLSILRTYTA